MSEATGAASRGDAQRPLLALLLAALIFAAGSQAPVRGAELPPQPEGPRGPQPFVTILCRAADSETAPPETPAAFAELLGSAPPGLDDYWREVSYGQINLEGSRVTEWYTMPESWAAYHTDDLPGPDFDRLAMDCVAAADAEVHFPDYAGINLVFDTPTLRAWAGARRRLELDGVSQMYGITWIGRSQYRFLASWAHEMGHALGLAHSTVSAGDEYGSPWDVMSRSGPCAPDPAYGSLPQHPIAYDKYQLGWIPAGRVFVAPSSGAWTLDLARLALPAAEGYLMVLVPIADSPGQFYTVEARRRAGYDIHLPADAVLIHWIDETQPLPARLVTRLPHGDGGAYEGIWPVGSQFTDPQHGIAISVDAESAGGFTVTVSTGLPRDLAAPPGDSRPEELGAGGPADHDLPLAAGGERSVVAATARGDLVAVWTARTSGTGGPPVRGEVWFAWREQQGAGGGAWEPAIRVSAAGSASGPALAVDGAGNTYVAWTEGSEGDFDIAFAYLGADEQAAVIEQITDDDPGLARSPAIAVDAGGSSYATWLDARDNQLSVYFAERPAGRRIGPGRWGPNVRLSPLDAEVRANPAIAADREGNLYVAWLNVPFCPGLSGKVGTIEGRIRPAGGEWGQITRVASGAGGGDLPELVIEVGETGRAYVEWTDGVTEVGRARFPG